MVAPQISKIMAGISHINPKASGTLKMNSIYFNLSFCESKLFGELLDSTPAAP